MENRGFATLAQLALEANKTITRSIDLEIWVWLQIRQTDERLPALGSRSRQSHIQEYRFRDLLALAPEVDEVLTRSIYLETSGLGSGSRQNNILEHSLYPNNLQDGTEID